MKLLFVHEHLGSFAGAEVNIQLTAEELRDRGHTVGLLYGSETGKGEEAWRETFAESFRLGEGTHEWKVKEVLASFAPDVVYVHKTKELRVLQELIESGLPVVRMVHDHEMYCMRGYKYNWLTRHVCKRGASFRCVFPCLAFVARNPVGKVPVRYASYQTKLEEIELNRRCDRLVVYSDYTRRELVRNGFDSDRISIHVPIRCGGAEAPVSSFSDRNLVLYAGQVIRGKGVDVLLRALKRVQAPYECVILGDGNHRAYCERLCGRLGLRDRVKFLGFVPPERSRKLYLQSSVFVVSSVWPEPFGMVGPEAMRHGLPVVAFDAGGIREWLINGENGYLVPWMDTEAFAGKVELLLRNKELGRELGQRGRERVSEQYESGKQVDGLETMFRQLTRPVSETVRPHVLYPVGSNI
jgi:glycosyltransferase involved in cell wall biosynthesis